MSYQEALIRKRRLGIPDDAEEFVKEPVFEADQVVGFNANPAQVRPRVAGSTLHAQMMPPPAEQTQLQTRPRIANPRRAAALAALDGDGSVLDDAATTDRIPDRPYIDPASANQPADSRERTVTYDRITGRPNDDFYRDREDATGLHRAYQNWEPRGAKRGWKNSLKSALMMGAEAARNNPNDPMTAGLAGLAIGLAGGTAAPNFKNRLLRNWKLAQTGNEAKTELELNKLQAQTAESIAKTRPKPIAAKLFQGADGLQYEYDPATKTAHAIPGQGRRSGSAKVLRTVERAGKVWYETEEGLQPALDPSTGVQLEAESGESFVDVPGYGRVRAGAAYTADRAAGDKSHADVVEAQKVDYENSIKRYEEADKAVGELRKIIRDAQEAAVAANNPPADATEQDKRLIWQTYEDKKREAQRFGRDIKARYPDLVEDDDMAYPTRMKPRPSRSAPPVRGRAARSGGRTIEGAIQAFKDKVKRAPNAEEIEKMRVALGQ